MSPNLVNPYIKFGGGGCPCASFDSIYEAKQGLSTVQKQRQVEWFSGQSLHSLWALRHTGSGSGTMSDTICGGYAITTGGADNNFSYIEYGTTDCNSKRKYSCNGAVAIGLTKAISTVTAKVVVGFNNDTSSGKSIAYSGFDTDADGTNFGLVVSDCSACPVSFTSFGVAKDTSYHTFKTEIRACDVQGTIDGGCVDATDSTCIPNEKEMPVFAVVTRAAAAKTGHILYYEAYNT